MQWRTQCWTFLAPLFFKNFIYLLVKIVLRIQAETNAQNDRQNNTINEISIGKSEISIISSNKVSKNGSAFMFFTLFIFNLFWISDYAIV